MISEKAFRDWCWCPQSLREEEGAARRLYPNRDDDDSVAQVVEVLTGGRPNRRALAARVAGGFRAEAYGGVGGPTDLWLVVPTEAEPLLLVVRDATRVLRPGTARTTVRRLLRKPPFDDRERLLEAHLRMALWGAFHAFLPYDDLKVESVVAGSFEVETTDAVDDAAWADANRFFAEVGELLAGDRRPEPLPRRCPHCRWRGCPRRVESAGIVLDPSGKPTEGAW